MPFQPIKPYVFESYQESEVPKQDVQTQDESGNQVVAGFKSGIDGLQATAYGAAALFGDAIDSKSLFDFGLEGYKRNIKESQNDGLRVSDYGDVHDTSDAFDYTMGAIGQAIPSAFMMLGTGGIGGLVAKKGIEMAAKKAIEKRIKAGITKKADAAALFERVMKSKATLNTIRKGQFIGAAAGSIGSETGSVYGDVAEKGHTGTGAITGSLATGIVAGGLDILPFLGVAKKFGFGGELSSEAAKKIASYTAKKRIGLATLETAGKEGVTEAIQTGIEEVGIAGITGDALPSDLGHQMINAGLLGAIGGGALGGVSAIPSPHTPEAQQQDTQSEPQAPQDQQTQQNGNSLSDFANDINNFDTSTPQPSQQTVGRDMATDEEDHAALDTVDAAMAKGESKRTATVDSNSRVPVHLPQGDLGYVEQQPQGIIDGQIMSQSEADRQAIAQFEATKPHALDAPKQASSVGKDGSITQGTEADIASLKASQAALNHQVAGLLQIAQSEQPSPIPQKALPAPAVMKGLNPPKIIANQVSPSGVTSPFTEADASLAEKQNEELVNSGMSEVRNAVHKRTITRMRSGGIEIKGATEDVKNTLKENKIKFIVNKNTDSVRVMSSKANDAIDVLSIDKKDITTNKNKDISQDKQPKKKQTAKNRVGYGIGSGGAIKYTSKHDITIDGIDFFIGKNTETGWWGTIEKTTGLSIGAIGDTKKEAIADTHRITLKNKARMKDVIANTKKVSQEDLQAIHDGTMSLTTGRVRGEVFKAQSDGKSVYGVATGRGNDHTIHSTLNDAQGKVESLKRQDAAHAETLKKDAELEKIAADKKAKEEDLQGFDKGMASMKRGRSIKTLLKMGLYENYGAMSRKHWIEKSVDEGAIVRDNNLVYSDGRLNTQKDITKTGIDYAKYLIDKKEAPQTSSHPKQALVKSKEPERNMQDADIKTAKQDAAKARQDASKKEKKKVNDNSGLSNKENETDKSTALYSKGNTTTGQSVEATKHSLIKTFGTHMKRAIEKGRVIVHSTDADAPEGVKKSEHVSNPRVGITRVRGGWTKDKIRKEVKRAGGRTSGTFVHRFIKEFASSKDLASHIFYHGTGGYVSRGLRPSITMSERDAERLGGGGYGERYFTISLSKSKNIASNFTGMSSHGTVYPVILKKGATVIDMPEIQDSNELDEIIVSLWEKGIDAVRIGDWNSESSEQEISILNPSAIFKYNESDSYPVFNKKAFIALTDKEIDSIYKDAIEAVDTYNEELSRATNKDERNAVLDHLPALKFSKDGKIQGWYDPDGTVHIVAENNDESTLAGVMLHEAKHSFDESAKGKVILAKSIKQVQAADELAGNGKGNVAAWMQDAKDAIPSNTPAKDYYHELFAYAVQQYQTNIDAMPKTIKNIVKRYLDALAGFVRAHLLKAGLIVKITPATLASLAQGEVRQLGKREGVASGENAYASNDDIRYSKAATRKYTDDVQKVKDKLHNPTTKATVADAIKQQYAVFKDTWYQGTIDQFSAINKNLNDKRSWIMAHLTKSAPNIIEGIIKHGAPEMHQNAVRMLEGSKSLNKIFSPLLEETNDFLQWIAVNRMKNINDNADAAGRKAEVLTDRNKSLRSDINTLERDIVESDNATDRGQLREVLYANKKELTKNTVEIKHLKETLSRRDRTLTDKEINIMLTINQGRMENGKDRAKVYEAVRKDFEALHAAIVKMAVDNHLVSKEEAAKWIEEGFYVPFYRALEDVGGVLRGASVTDKMVGQTAYKIRKGSDKPLNDLLSNVLGNWNHLVSASLNNQAALSALKTASKMGAAKQVKKSTKSKNAVFVRANGKKVWFEVSDPLVLESLTALDFNGLNNGFMKTMRWFKRALTIGVTASPEFKIRNMFRDTIQALAVAKMSKNPFGNVAQGWKATNVNSKSYTAMLFGGGSFGQSGYIHGTDPDAVKQLVKLNKAGGLITDPANFAQHLWETYQDFGARLENVNRAANFEQALSDGRDLLTANFEARDHLDFSRTGSWVAVRAITQIIPFLNARMQGLDKVARAAMDKNQQAQFIAVVGTYSALSVMLYALMAGDDDYKDAEDWEKDTYHLIKLSRLGLPAIHDAKGNEIMFKIPRPFEVGAIANLFERIAQQGMDDKATGADFGNALWFTATQTLGIDPRPQIFKPAMEVYANKNAFTGRAIESMGMKFMPTTDRSKPWTSDSAIAASKTMGAVLPDAITLSPVQIQHLVRGYFGYIGTVGLGAMDMIVTRNLNGAAERPDWRMSEYPVIKAFVDQTPLRHTKYATDVYDALQEVNQTFNTIQRYRKGKNFKAATELENKNKVKLLNRHMLNTETRRVSQLNKKAALIFKDRVLTGAQKTRKLDDINRMKNIIFKRAAERIQK